MKTVTVNGQDMSLPQLLVTLGMMGYRREPIPAGMPWHETLRLIESRITLNTCRAARAFDSLLQLAVQRGYDRKERRRLVSNMRAGNATGIALQRAEQVLGLVTEDEVLRQLRWIGLASSTVADVASAAWKEVLPMLVA